MVLMSELATEWALELDEVLALELDEVLALELVLGWGKVLEEVRFLELEFPAVEAWAEALKSAVEALAAALVAVLALPTPVSALAVELTLLASSLPTAWALALALLYLHLLTMA